MYAGLVGWGEVYRRLVGVFGVLGSRWKGLGGGSVECIGGSEGWSRGFYGGNKM